MNLKQLSHDIYHAARGDKCRIEDIQNMLEKALNVAETKGYTDAEYDHGLALDSLEDKPIALAVEGLNPETLDLVRRFAQAMAEKLKAAQDKYGYGAEWAKTDWGEACQAHLLEHLAKGDPRDVANYCAFLWHHGLPTQSALPDAEIWQHANDTVVMADMVRLGKENETLRRELEEWRLWKKEQIPEALEISELRAAAEADKAREPQKKRRLLRDGDVMREGDEYLGDDAETWTALPKMWHGRKFGNFLQPVRRKALQRGTTQGQAKTRTEAILNMEEWDEPPR